MPRDAITHMLKTDHELFKATWEFKKLYEMRLNDRDYQQGDNIVLQETVNTGSQMKIGKPLEYTGREITGKIGHVIAGRYGLKKGWCTFGLCQSARFTYGK